MSLSRALDLARLALLFARVERVTRHEDGIRPETEAERLGLGRVVAIEEEVSGG